MLEAINLSNLRLEAEVSYRNGDYYCSEAIVSAIRNHIDPTMPIEAIAMASGFPVGIGGAQCVCGAVSGGVLCIGYFFGRTEPKSDRIEKAMRLANELHESFSKNHKNLCCRILTKSMELGSEAHMKQCISFTGEVAEKTAAIIAREFGLKIQG